MLTSMSLVVLARICVLGVGSVVVVNYKGGLPPARVVLHNWRTRLKRYYFDVLRWF